MQYVGPIYHFFRVFCCFFFVSIVDQGNSIVYTQVTTIIISVENIDTRDMRIQKHLIRPVGSIFEVQRPLKKIFRSLQSCIMYSMFDIDDDNSIANVNTLI